MRKLIFLLVLPLLFSAFSVRHALLRAENGFIVQSYNATDDDKRFAFFPTPPYVGNPTNNVADLADAKLYLTLTADSTIENGLLYAFVYYPDDTLSIGFFKLSFTQRAGETKEYTAEYKKSGSQAANLEYGKTYELVFRFFEDRKEKVFDWRYNDMSFSIAENSMGIVEPLEEGAGRERTDRKVMREDGSIVIEQGVRRYGIPGILIK